MRGRGVWSLGASVLGQLFYLGILVGYPLVNKQFAIEHGLVEIVDLPINSMGGSFHSFSLVTRGYHIFGGQASQHFPGESASPMIFFWVFLVTW